MPESQFNTIVILDAVPEGELGTARRLREDLDDISYYIAENLKVRYFRLNTIEDLESGISSILEEIRRDQIKPWLHLDGHGLADQNGFVFAEGTSCSWAQLKQIITPINLELNLNLILILATCFGGSFASAIETTDRAPVLGLIGPSREVSAGEIERAFPVFYKTLFSTQSLGEALSALDNGAPPGLYYRTSAERFFYNVWASYKTTSCTDEAIAFRARKLYRKLKKEKAPSCYSVGQIKRNLRSRENEVFAQFRDLYFMHDLDENNMKRFPVTYNSAELYAKKSLTIGSTRRRGAALR